MALLRNLKIDPKSLGKHLWLVDATPVVEYTKSGERTDKIVGYRYVVTLPAHGFEKLGIKIADDQQIELPDDTEYIPVQFDGLDIRVYEANGHAQLTASATSIHAVKEVPHPPGTNGNR